MPASNQFEMNINNGQQDVQEVGNEAT